MRKLFVSAVVLGSLVSQAALADVRSCNRKLDIFEDASSSLGDSLWDCGRWTSQGRIVNNEYRSAVSELWRLSNSTADTAINECRGLLDSEQVVNNLRTTVNETYDVLPECHN